MQGEYRGDFTRDTFHRANHFCRVLQQQGRVQLDADWNEQASILLHFLRSLGGDLIGQHGGPGGPAASGFALSAATTNKLPDLQISTGHYYVDGILCEATPPGIPGPTFTPGLTYLNQPDLRLGPALPAPGTVLVYLDVWERHVTCVQQDLLREVALGGPDTASRAKLIWQVKFAVQPPLDGDWPQEKLTDAEWLPWVELWQPANRGLLKAQVQPEPMSADVCVISPKSSYRGTENQLYRVEIHQNGSLASASTDAKPAAAPAGPSYKWSRENGSVVFPILKLATSANQTTVTLASLGRDSRLSLQINDWVEVVDDNSTLSGIVDSLLQVVDVDPVNLVVTLAGTSAIVVDQPPTAHPILRRWDGVGQIAEDNGPNWLLLEDGIQIQFQPVLSGDAANQYRSGDYWLIPARVATGDIEWPQQTDPQGNQGPAAQPPHGVEHHYAPLAVVSISSAANGGTTILDLRRFFTAQAT